MIKNGKKNLNKEKNMDKKDSKTGTKLNLPILKKQGGALSVKKDSNVIKKINLESIKKKNEMDKILKEDSIKVQMQKEKAKKMGLDLVLVGDFTESMRDYREVLRQKFKELCATLLKIIPNLRVGIVFYLDHGAYPNCFRPEYNPYITKTHKLSTDIESLNLFIDSVGIGNGIDYDEAVEDALNEVLNLNWSEINKKSVVLFGDARAHEPHECDKGYDYFTLTQKLYNKEVVINSVFCNPSINYKSLADLYKVDIGDFSKRVSRLNHDEFFSWIANVTGGIAMGVEQIDDLVDIIKGMAAKDAGKFDELEEENLKHTKKEIPMLKFIKEKAKQIENKKNNLRLGYNKSQ